MQPALNATGNSPSLWGPKANQTIRLAASLTDNTDIMSDQARQGYEFWAYTLNQLHKGFQIGLANSSRQITVDLRFMTDNLDPVRHGMNMIAAVREGSTDFLLGGNTNLAWQDFNASVASERITMLCCHGPPTVYQTAAALGQSGFNPNTSLKAQDYLFGIQYNSEQYTTALINQIALNQKAKMIAIVARTSVDPNQNLFANTTCQAAVNQIKAIFTSGQYSAPPNYRLFNTDASQENNLTYFRELAKVIRNETVNGVHYDMVLGCTLEKDGKNLLAALQLEMVPLKAVFATFAPSRASIVEELAQCQNITMADTLTAGQWHPQLPFVDQNPGVLWPSATAFASAFQIHNPLLTVTYTHAAAAAACFALQTAFVQAFKSCDLTDWNGDTDELLYSDKWMCEAMAPGMTMKTGYDMVLYSLRNLRRDSFYGPLQFDDIQQNSGRDTVTLQLQATPNVATASVVGSVNFGCDADGKTLLLEQIVLPSDYETKSIIMPRPPRPYDRPCPDGQGLDANNDCQPCAPGTARGGIGSISSDAWNCYSCNLTSYADAPGMAQCTACPQGTQTNVLGADSIAMCSCMSGYYNETGLTGVPCSACPAGASCPGGVAPPQALPGYWTNSSSPNTLADVFACSPPQSCLNDPITGQTCATGWGGNICSLCGYANKESGTQKYFLVFGSCVVCNSKAAAFFAFVAVLILWILINLFIGMNWESVALAVDWLQMMSLVGNINANWPMSLQFFFNLAQFFAFEVSVVSWECVAPSWNFLYDMILQFSLPIFLISCWLALGGLHLCLKRLRKRYLEKGLEKEVVEDLVLEGSPEDGISKIDHNAGTSLYHKAFGSITSATIAASAITSGFDRFDWSRDAIIGRVLNILEITYLASTLYAMSALRSISVSGESVLANYPYTVQTTAVIVVGAVGLVLFSIAFPLFLIIKLWTLSPDSLWRRTLYGDTYRRLEDPGGFRKEENIKMLGWLYEKFRVERYYMAHMHLLHRFVFIAAISFVVDPAIQLVLTISFTLMFAALFIMTRPYFLPRLNILQAVLYMSIVFILGCGAAFYSPYASYEGAQWNTAFEVLGFVIIGGGGLVFGWIATVEILENLCSILAKEALYQEAESTSRQVGEAQVKALAEIFSSVRLWR